MITLLWNIISTEGSYQIRSKYHQNSEFYRLKCTEYVLRSTIEGKEIIENLSYPLIYLSDWINANQDLNWKA